MKIFRSVFDLLFETWKWSNIVSKSKLLLLHQQRLKNRDEKEVIIPAEPTGDDLLIAQRIVTLVAEEIEFVKKTPIQKETWLSFGGESIPDSSSIRYYVVKNVREKSGVVLKWTKITEILISF